MSNRHIKSPVSFEFEKNMSKEKREQRKAVMDYFRYNSEFNSRKSEVSEIITLPAELAELFEKTQPEEESYG